MTLTVQDVVQGGFCIGCGICAVSDPSIKIKDGVIFKAELPLKAVSPEVVCPFASQYNEDELADEAFLDKDMEYSRAVGYYNSIFSGHVTGLNDRVNSSSGGLATWLLCELLRLGRIDGVIHVGKSDPSDDFFAYKISSTSFEIKENSKSRYYPVELSQVLGSLKNDGKRYALVGIPCYIKAVRLLSKKNEIVRNSIVYYIGIFCGHLKSKAFAEMIGWQAGINPNDLTGVDFRVKNDKVVNKYSVRIEGLRKGEATSGLIGNSEIIGSDWGEGLFKPKACEWCDDIAVETADIAFGDAWLDKYKSDSNGRNIVVVRNEELKQILLQGKMEAKITLATETVEDVYASQAGNYRHRQEGLAHRIDVAKKNGIIAPIKRDLFDASTLSVDRKNLYDKREKMSEISNHFFSESKHKNSLWFFLVKIFPYQARYHRVNGRLIKFLVRYTFMVLKLFIRKMK